KKHEGFRRIGKAEPVMREIGERIAGHVIDENRQQREAAPEIDTQNARTRRLQAVVFTHVLPETHEPATGAAGPQNAPRLIAPAVHAPGAGARRHEIEEDEAVEGREFAAIHY